MHSWDARSGAPGSGFLAQEGGLNPHALLHLLLVLVEEEGDLLDPRKVVPTVGDTVPYPINSILSQLVASPWQTGLSSLRAKGSLLEVSRSRIFL